MECGMERFHRGFTAAEKTELWDRWKRGESLKAIGRAFGKESSSIYFLVAPHGGIRPAERRRSKLALTLAEREVISRGVTAHQSARSIAKSLGRSPSTVSREMNRNGGYDRYRATVADENAWARSRRPKCCKLAVNSRLRQSVAGKLRLDWSPEQIAGWLKRTHPEDECTVGALGMPFGNIPGISRSSFGWLHTGLRVPIENAFHAMAIDEHRRAFEPTLWTVRKPRDPKAIVAAPRALESVEQRWFVGAHANVGGGYPSDLLAQIPLRWMMKKASAQGLAFKNDIDLDGNALMAGISDFYREFMYGAYSKCSRRYYRTIGETPREDDDGTHTNVNETIDASVFDRYRADTSYRPPNMVEWAKRYQVAPAELRSSVRANEPKNDVPD